MKCFSASLILLGFGLGWVSNASAQTPVPPPTCLPTPSAQCIKVITFYNNPPPKGAGITIYPVIQAGIQNPDPWLQAVFNDSSQPFGETHYSRIYINPQNGIPPGGSVKVSLPWYSTLSNDPSGDQFIDWWNGARIVIFDTAAAVNQAYTRDKASPLSVTAPLVSCITTCELPLVAYSDTKALPSDIPFQLLEYTFAQVDTLAAPFILSLNVGYNISYLDQIYLPVAQAPCRTEPCDPNVQDPTAVGYLGTTKDTSLFRSLLTKFSNAEGWPAYLDALDDVKNRPRLPGAYNIFTALVAQQNNPLTTFPFTKIPNKSAVNDMISQWKTCTSPNATATECPQFMFYQTVSNYFSQNYSAYINTGLSNGCTSGPNYPNPATLTQLPLQQYVYGWAAFLSGCPAGFNPLLTSPGPKSAFDQTIFQYIQLQYNWEKYKGQLRFNPFVELVHGKYIDANSYAFSIDDAAGFQSNPGDGLIIAVGGSKGLPNNTPVVLPADFSKDFEIDMGDTVALNRPRWKSYQICKGGTVTNFPPLPPNPKQDTPKIIVDTVLNNISSSNPCTITIRDAKDKVYQIEALSAVPWAVWPPIVKVPPPPRFDPSVMSCPKIPTAANWCMQINELSTAEPRFAILTPPSLP
jgi:hypothetical protein